MNDQHQSRIMRALAAALVVSMTVAAAAARYPGLNPSSLWFDDVWMGALMKTSSVREMLALQAHVPSGFLVLLRAVHLAVPDVEVGLQLLPFLAGLAAIPVMGWAAHEVVRRPGAFLLGAALAALNPLLAKYSVHVKTFSTAYLVSAVLLGLAARAGRKPGWKTMATLVLTGWAGILLSYGTLIVSAAAVSSIALIVLFDRELDRQTRVLVPGLGALFLLVAGAIAGGISLSQANPSLLNYWKAFYLPLNSITVAWTFLHETGVRAMTGAMPDGWQAAAWLVLPGLAGLLWFRETRAVGLAAAFTFTGFIFASSLQLYPIGTGRTDMFSYPVTQVLVAAGCMVLFSRGFLFRRIASAGIGLVCLVSAVSPLQSEYNSQVDGRTWMQALERFAEDGDAVILHPHANWLAACYGSWPVEFLRSTELAPGFAVRLKREHAAVLTSSWPDEQLKKFLDVYEGERLLYLAERVHVPAHYYPVVVDQLLQKTFSAYGFKPVETWGERATRLMLYEKAGQGR